MRVLLLGPTGQLGSELQLQPPAGHQLTLLPEDRLDLRRTDELRHAVRELRPALVINAAAYTDVDRAEADPDLSWAINAEAVRALAETLAEGDGRLIHVSTDYVFDGTQGQPYRPDDPPAPLNVYGASKRQGELHALRTLGPRAAVVRTSWLYANGGRNFVTTMLTLLRERELLRVVDDQIGTPTWARHLAGALWTLADHPELAGLYHFTNAGAASWYDFAVAIREEGSALGLLPRAAVVEPIPTSEFPRPAKRPAFSVMDKTASWAALGGPAEHWREALRQMLRGEC